jgi:hypothetical protein
MRAFGAPVNSRAKKAARWRAERLLLCSSGPLTASPPGEKTTAHQDQARQSRTGDRAWHRARDANLDNLSGHKLQCGPRGDFSNWRKGKKPGATGLNDKRQEKLGGVQGPLKLREPVKDITKVWSISPKCQEISVAVASNEGGTGCNEGGVQETAPPEAEPKVPIKGPIPLRNAVSVSCQLWIAWG